MKASCCVSLRTATLIIGFVNTVTCLGMLGYWTLFLVRDGVEPDHEKNSTHLHASQTNLKITTGISSFPAAPIWICCVYIVYSIISAGLNVCLIFGASDENPTNIKTWLTSTGFVNVGVACATLTQIIVFLVNNQIKFATVWFISLMAGMVLYIYTFVVAKAFHRKLFEEDKQQIINSHQRIPSAISEESI